MLPLPSGKMKPPIPPPEPDPDPEPAVGAVATEEGTAAALEDVA